MDTIKTLRELCFAGSHDAGMYTLYDCTSFAGSCTTQTQGATLLNQIKEGSRYFDIRPGLEIASGDYYACHFSDTGFPLLGNQGCFGVNLASCFLEIKEAILANEIPSTVLIFKFSHYFVKDTGVYEFSAAQTEALINLVQYYLDPWLYKKPDRETRRLVDIPIQIMLDQTDSQVAILATFAKLDPALKQPGIYSYGSYTAGKELTQDLMVYDKYSDTNDLATMISDQYARMMNPANHGGDLYLVSWTLTQSKKQAITCISSLGVGTSVQDLADLANPELNSFIDNMVLYNRITTDVFPNILYVDFMAGFAGDAAATVNGEAPVSELYLGYRGEITSDLYTCRYMNDEWEGNFTVSDQLGGIAPKCSYAPACVFYIDKLYMIYRKDDENALYYCWWNGYTWEGNIAVTVEGVQVESEYGPSACIFNDKIYLVYVLDDYIYTAYFYGSQWYGNTKIEDQPGGIDPKTKYWPGCTVYNNRIYIAYVSNDVANDDLCTAYYNGSQWYGNEKIEDQPNNDIGNPKSKYGPSMAVYNNKLYIVYVGNTTYNIFYCYYDGSEWYGNKEIKVGETNIKTINSPPGVAVYDSKLYLIYRGELYNSFYYTYYDGSVFYGNANIVINESGAQPASQYCPGVVFLGST